VRYRSLKTLTHPKVEPVSLADAKAHCRVDTDADNAYIASLITAAREWCAAYCDETFVHTRYMMTLDSFPTNEVELPRPPMATHTAYTAVTVTYTLENQTTATLAANQYRVDRDSVPGFIRTLYNGSWPSHLMDYNAVTVTWWGGRGEDGTDVEQRIRNAILWLVGYWYERRMAADGISMTEIPFGVKSLLDSAKWGSYL
jgi:uncharacterized phiE125 gp8 family phage protein